MELNDSEKKAFQAFQSFVDELFEQYPKDHQLALYHRLLEKTSEEQVKSVRRHLEGFTTFYVANEESILKNQLSQVEGGIRYSDRVSIPLSKLLKRSDVHTQKAIQAHLLAIGSQVSASDKAKSKLKEVTQQLEQTSLGGGNGGDPLMNLLGGLMGGAGGGLNLGDGKGPTMTADGIKKTVSTMMESGIVEKMVDGFRESTKGGQLDFGTLMSSMMAPLEEMDREGKFDELKEELEGKKVEEIDSDDEELASEEVD